MRPVQSLQAELHKDEGAMFAITAAVASVRPELLVDRRLGLPGAIISVETSREIELPLSRACSLTRRITVQNKFEEWSYGLPAVGDQIDGGRRANQGATVVKPDLYAALNVRLLVCHHVVNGRHPLGLVFNI